MNPSHQCGIVYHAPGAMTKTYLPLKHVRIRAVIVDLSARITLTQLYTNPLAAETGRCKYYFPIPASAAICAFYMSTSDGKSLVGISKEKDTAREEHEAAIQSETLTGLVEYVTDDVFTISLGSISPETSVKIELAFVMTLMNEDNIDEIRFQLPMSVGERYGPLPPGLSDAAPGRSSFRIVAEIQTSERIRGIKSPSHGENLTVTPYSTNIGRDSLRRYTVEYRSTTFLERDFILIVHADQLDSPRCFAELMQESDHGGLTLALQFTLVPKVKLPRIDQEYIFVLDRSGSMSGGRIDTAKRTLKLLLRMLPVSGTTFNVYFFDHEFSPVWPTSQVYGSASLMQANSRIETIESGGGTELFSVLQEILGSRQARTPTAIFLLTDGDVNDNGEIFSLVHNNVQGAPKHAPIRIFVLGIGHGISTAMCEGIARAGNGTCLYATEAESIVGKCARLFRAGKTAFIKDVSIDWGISAEQLRARQPLVTFSGDAPRSGDVIRSLLTVQQAPAKISQLHAGTRMSIFAILQLRASNVPKRLTLRGKIDNETEDPFELSIDIKGVSLRSAKDRIPLIHTLAAWNLIREHGLQLQPLPEPVDPQTTEDDIRKAVVIQLGQKYQLSSAYTSFVAVDSVEYASRRRNKRNFFSPNSPQADEETGRPTVDQEDDASLAQQIRQRLKGLYFSIFGTSNVKPDKEDDGFPGAWPNSSGESINNADSTDDGYESERTFTTLSSLEGSSSGWSDWSVPPSPTLSAVVDPMPPSPQLRPVSLAPNGMQRPVVMVPPPRVDPPPLKSEVVELMNLQRFDGSFLLDNPTLRQIVGSAAVDEANNLQVDDAVWATAISVAFIRKCVGNQTQFLDDLLEKAMEFLGEKSAVDVSELLRRADALLQV